MLKYDAVVARVGYAIWPLRSRPTTGTFFWRQETRRESAAGQRNRARWQKA